jgi:hypothetical protein
LLIEGQEHRPTNFKVGQPPNRQKLAQTVPTLWPPPARRRRPTMIDKQNAALSLDFLSKTDKLLTLAAPVSGPLSSSLGTRITAKESLLPAR